MITEAQQFELLADDIAMEVLSCLSTEPANLREIAADVGLETPVEVATVCARISDKYGLRLRWSTHGDVRRVALDGRDIAKSFELCEEWWDTRKGATP